MAVVTSFRFRGVSLLARIVSVGDRLSVSAFIFSRLTLFCRNFFCLVVPDQAINCQASPPQFSVLFFRFSINCSFKWINIYFSLSSYIACHSFENFTHHTHLAFVTPLSSHHIPLLHLLHVPLVSISTHKFFNFSYHHEVLHLCRSFRLVGF